MRIVFFSVANVPSQSAESVFTMKLAEALVDNGHDVLVMAQGIESSEGDLSEAERSLRRAADVRPGVGDVHMNLGLVLLHRGDREGAQRELRRALLLNPSLVTAAAQLGHILFQDGRYAEAAHFYGGCVQLGREDLRSNLREALSRARASGTPLR